MRRSARARGEIMSVESVAAKPSIEHLRPLAGDEELDPAVYSVCGAVPRLVVAPRDAQQARAVVEAAQGLTCIPYGGGSRVHVGGAPHRYDYALSTQKLTGVVRYEPADLVASFRAGTPLQEVQDTLAEHGQWLPWEPEFGGPRTFGGALATNTGGPTQDGFGLPRDRILQLMAVTGYGKRIVVGAPVVKSVAGYDIHRLFCGSWGTLGLIVEATVRTEPLATRARRTMALSGWDELAERADEADRLGACLASIVVRVAGAITATYSLWGSEAAVTWACDRVGGEDAAPPLSQEGPTLVRFVAAPADSLGLARRIQDSLPGARLTLRPVSGVVWVETEEPVGKVLSASEGFRASWRVERGATDRHWSEPEAMGLMRQVKATFDPNGLFNPGRFAGGL